MKDRFTSAAQVIAHDPVQLITTYLKNLLRLPGRVLTQRSGPGWEFSVPPGSHSGS